DWVEKISSQLGVAPNRVLPHQDLLDDLPIVLGKAAEFLLTPDTEKLTAEQLVTTEMKNIALLRRTQGFEVQEIIREFDELAQILDGAALRWVEDYPGTPDPKGVGRVFGRLNRVPLLMGEITVGTLEQERNELLRRLTSAEEHERLRLSRELHDQMGQLVTALLLGLKGLARGENAGDESEQIEDLEKLADRIGREVQQLAFELRAPALDNLGLRLALRGHLEEWAAANAIECDFQSVGLDSERFPQEVEIALYRVVQEGLTNVLKHAEASRVSLLVERRRGILSIILEDNGKGFEPDAVLGSGDGAKRLGLRGMRERVKLLGGQLDIESSPAIGTTLFVRIPHTMAPAGEDMGHGR
ncbi:MAG: sensor histidine kinase, partial [Gemmatimonadetes bacterium]|nr:sensor histidine kinase [Gemmatimonadota bacterium]